MNNLINIIIIVLFAVILGSIFIQLLPFILLLIAILGIYVFIKYRQFKKELDQNSTTSSYTYYQNPNDESVYDDVIDVEYSEKDE